MFGSGHEIIIRNGCGLTMNACEWNFINTNVHVNAMNINKHTNDAPTYTPRNNHKYWVET